jgi:hypothetical protein
MKNSAPTTLAMSTPESMDEVRAGVTKIWEADVVAVEDPVNSDRAVEGADDIERVVEDRDDRLDILDADVIVFPAGGRCRASMLRKSKLSHRPIVSLWVMTSVRGTLLSRPTIEQSSVR